MITVTTNRKGIFLTLVNGFEVINVKGVKVIVRKDGICKGLYVGANSYNFAIEACNNKHSF